MTGLNSERQLWSKICSWQQRKMLASVQVSKFFGNDCLGSVEVPWMANMRSSQFCWHQKNCNHVYWNNLLRLKKVKRIRNYVLKRNFYLYFLICWFLKNSYSIITQGVCHVIYIFLVIIFILFIFIFRICVTDFREGGLFAPPFICEQLSKGPSWIGLMHQIPL